MSSSKIFLGINITLFLKNKHIFQENQYCSLTWSANISLKFPLQTQKNMKIPKHKLAYMRYFFSVIIQKAYTAQVSYCQNPDIREVSIDLL